MTNKKTGIDLARVDLRISSDLLEMSADPTLLVNKDGDIEYANSGVEEAFGYARAEMLREPIALLVPERNRAEHPSNCQRYFLDPKKRVMRPLHLDAWGQRKNGSEFPVRITLAPLKGEGDLMALVTVHDVTERRLTETALRESENKYRQLVATANDAILIFDLERGLIAEANQKAGQLLGRKPEQIVGMQIIDMFPGDEGEENVRLLNELSRCGQGVVKNLKVRHNTGRTIPVEISAASLALDGRNIMQGIFRDVSEERATAETLATRAHQQAIVAEIGQLAIGETNLDALMQVITERVAETLNVEYCKVLELSPDEHALLLRAGIGWKKGYVGQAEVSNDTGSQAGYTLLSDRPVIVDNLGKETRFAGTAFLTEHAVVSGISVVIRGKDKPFGVLGAHTKTERTFNADDANFFQAIANILAGAINRNRAEEALGTKDHEIRQTYVDVFFAVTGGKLIIVTEEELQASRGRQVNEMLAISSYEELGGTRATLREIISTEFPNSLNMEEVITAAGEAITNAVKHSGAGEVHLFRTDDALQIMVKDSGPGIDFSLLPKATLMAGFSTKQTLGIGFTLMLEFCDRLFLSTRPGGTTVVLETSARHS